MATKIVLMGPPSDNVPIQQLMRYAVRLLGLMAERISEEKGTKQILNHTAGPTTKDKPQANAAGADTRPPGNTKKGKDGPKTDPGPMNAIPCKYFGQEKGCRRGSTCTHFHPRLTKEDGRCFNCGGTGHTTHECDKPKPPKKPTPKPHQGEKGHTGDGKGKGAGKTAGKGKSVPHPNPATGNSTGKGGKPKGKAKGKPKPKASAASASAENANEAEGAPSRFCMRLKP
eukprot:3063240-Amphidinium_carterae.1